MFSTPSKKGEEGIIFTNALLQAGIICPLIYLFVFFHATFYIHYHNRYNRHYQYHASTITAITMTTITATIMTTITAITMTTIQPLLWQLLLPLLWQPLPSLIFYCSSSFFVHPFIKEFIHSFTYSRIFFLFVRLFHQPVKQFFSSLDTYITFISFQWKAPPYISTPSKKPL